MTWASSRRWMIIIGSILVVLIALGALAFFIFYKAPSCVDGKKNGKEEGIDCGGTCAYICSAGLTAPTTRFVRALTQNPQRTDVVTYIDNPNPSAAARGVKYSIELYGSDNVVIARYEGLIDLPPASTVPVFIPGVFAGPQPVNQAFIAFDQTSIHWYRSTQSPMQPPVSDIVVTPGSSPKVTATITNPLATPLLRVPVVATVFDAQGNVIAASETLVPVIPPQGTAPLVFTWNESFSGTAARVDLLPVLPLPGSSSL